MRRTRPVEQLGVAAERRRVAAHEHEDRCAGPDECGGARLAQPAARRVGDTTSIEQVVRRVPAADLAPDDLAARPSRFSWASATADRDVSMAITCGVGVRSAQAANIPMPA